jgi:hypothetical protein
MSNAWETFPDDIQGNFGKPGKWCGKNEREKS